MSFDTLKVNELKEIAESFGIEMPVKATKQSLILALQDEGVTWDMYAKFNEAEQVEVKIDEQPKKKSKIEKGKTMLVRMDRLNPSYNTHGICFYKRTSIYCYV